MREDKDLVLYRDGAGETAFHYVVVENRMDLAKQLLAWGSEINTQDEFGATPLMKAVMLDYDEMVRWLVANGAALEPKNQNGETALVLASANEHQKIFEFLIELPRSHPIDFYYDDLGAQDVFDDRDLVMRDRLIRLGLSRRYD